MKEPKHEVYWPRFFYMLDEKKEANLQRKMEELKGTEGIYKGKDDNFGNRPSSIPEARWPRFFYMLDEKKEANLQRKMEELKQGLIH